MADRISNRWPRRMRIGFVLMMVAVALVLATWLTAGIDVVLRTRGNLEVGAGRGLFWVGNAYVPATHDDFGHPGLTFRRPYDKFDPLPWRWWQWEWFASPDDAFNAYQTRFPVWVFLLATGGLGAYLLCRGVRERRRMRTGFCASCGYSLSGLEAGVACPECGRAPV